MSEKRRLGRGLDALLGGPNESDNGRGGGSLTQVAVDTIVENPYQPRRDFDPSELATLRQSLETHGLLQPIVVRSTGQGYQLIAGERRLRAARSAGWSEIPVRVVDLNDQQVFEAAMVENLQRADLNPMEKAQAFQEYLQRFDMSHEQLAGKLGIDRTTVTNLIRLLELPPAVQESVRTGKISHGHAKVLLGLDDPARQEALCGEIIDRGLSVRAVESRIREDAAHASPRSGGAVQDASPTRTRHVQSLEDELRQRLAAKVEIRLRSAEKGQIVLHFESNDDFERMVEALRR